MGAERRGLILLEKLSRKASQRKKSKERDAGKAIPRKKEIQRKGCRYKSMEMKEHWGLGGGRG